MADRDLVRTACAAGIPGEARRAIEAFLEKNTGSAAYQFVAHQLRSAGERFGLREHRVAILSSFTTDTLQPCLAVQEFLGGRHLEFTSIPYEQWYPALTNKEALDDFRPDVTVLLLHLEDTLPLLARRHLAAEAELDAEADRLFGALESGLDAFRARSAAPVILATFIAAERGVERYFDRNARPSRQERIDDFNRRLSALARSKANLFVYDYAQTVTDFGRQGWFDPAKNHFVGAAVAAVALPTLAADLSALFTALIEPRGKVLAVDLDNTIWGGVVGEDGPEGIATGGNYPGNAYADFQAFLVNLRASGIALAAVSKNNIADVDEAFRANPHMPLRWDDFAAHRIDWNDKAGNLKALAEDLSLGIDSIVFADDNPLECDLVRTYAPEVQVVELTGPASLFAEQVVKLGRFDAVSLTEEDRHRADGYGAERERTALAAATETTDFLASLDLQLDFRPPTSGEIDRLAQLFTKTNQFNLTSKRYTAADILSMREDSPFRLDVARLADRYGDYGLIGAIVTVDGLDGRRVIDSFLMSCRALGRNVEDAMLVETELRARRDGVIRLVGQFVPTAKNGIVERFYADRGFDPGGTEGMFERDLTATAPLERARHIALSVEEREE